MGQPVAGNRQDCTVLEQICLGYVEKVVVAVVSELSEHFFEGKTT
jgi:hypothetical protein